MARRPVLIEAPPVQAAPLPAARSAPILPAPPPAPVKTGVLEAPQQVSAPPPRRVAAVQTGAFAQQVPPEHKPQPAIVAHAAGFGGGIAQKVQNEPERAVPLTARPAGFDAGGPPAHVNDPTRPATSTGAFAGAALVRPPGAGRPDVVHAGGFGSASANTGAPARPRQQTAGAGFGDTATAKPQPRAMQPAPDPAAATPVEVTFKPRPAYTDEARRLQVEGEVLVEVVFRASGEVELVRIIRGLGHGLNESAITAARSIRFRPATEQGRPVDTRATVRMSFELAY